MGILPVGFCRLDRLERGFMKSLTFIDNLKVRAGYGVTGNQDAIDPYQSLSLMAPNGTTLVDGSATTTFYIDSNQIRICVGKRSIRLMWAWI